jgi:Ferrochelatase
MEYRELAESNGIEQWRRVPALNTDERFINDMADIVVRTCVLCMCTCADGWMRACILIMISNRSHASISFNTSF